MGATGIAPGTRFSTGIFPVAGNYHGSYSFAKGGFRLSSVEDVAKEVIVTKMGERETIEKMKGFYFEYLMQTEKFEMLKVTVQPGAGTEELSHQGEESHLILAGELEVTVNKRVYRLKEGDSIWYNSEKPHKWKNTGDTSVIVYSIAFPRTYASLVMERWGK